MFKMRLLETGEIKMNQIEKQRIKAKQFSKKRDKDEVKRFKKKDDIQ